MVRRILATLLSAASIVALVPARTVVAQSAQTSASSGGGELEEVVVTARRREEKAQAVPITLLTFNPAQLQKQDIRDALTLTDSIPGFNGATGASLGLTYTFLRGAPGVIFYWDQVPINVNNQAQGFYFDMANIQVLYGPQGTLFGLSNDAGALLFEPKHPVNGYEGYAQATFGNYGRETIEGVVNVPIIDDKLLVRVGGQYQKQDGYQHVIQQNVDLLNQDYWNFRGAATFRPTDDFQNELMVNYFYSRYRPGAFTYAGYNPGVAQAFATIPAGIPGLIGTPGSLQYALSLAKTYLNPAGLAGVNINLAQLLAQQQALGPYRIAATSIIPKAQLDQLNIVDTATWDINDNITIKNIAAYQEINSYTNYSDIGGLQLGLLQGPTPLPDDPRGPDVQYNEEIQMLGNLLDNKLNYQVGFFNQWGGAASGAGGSTPSDSTAPYGIQYTNDFGGLKVSGATLTQVSRTDALYTQETYKLDDYVEGLSLTGGFRYTWDKFYTRGDTYTALGVLEPVTCVVGGKVITVGCPTSQSARYTSPAYTIQLNYQWRPQTMFYFNNSLGYKSGGFNGQALAVFQIFKPEHLNNYETGVKTDFDWGAIGLESVKTRVDASLYYGVYRGIEIQTTGAYLQSNGTVSLGTPYLDVGDGDLYGWDLQLTVLPTPDLELYAGAEYNKGKYKNFQGPNAAGTGQVSTPGVGFEILPEYKLDSHITYHFSFIDKAYGDVSWTGSYSWVQHSLASDVADVGYGDFLPGHHNVDMSLDWNDIMGHTGLLGRLWVTNLTNNSATNGCLCAYRAIGEIGFQPAQPQMYGVTLRYAFGE